MNGYYNVLVESQYENVDKRVSLGGKNKSETCKYTINVLMLVKYQNVLSDIKCYTHDKILFMIYNCAAYFIK